MARLFAALVRHGKYEQPEGVPSAHLPHPLTSEGIAQARTLAGILQAAGSQFNCAIDSRIDTSRLLRAWQTASILADGLTAEQGRPFEVVEFDALAERGLGAAANLTVEQIEAAVARDPRCSPLPRGWKLKSDTRLPFQGAETLLEAGFRVANHLETRLAALAETDERDTMKIFVGHGGSIRHAAVALGVLSPEAAPLYSMWHCSPVIVERIRRGEWAHRAGEWKARTAAEVATD